jgi:hypothetical protein
MAKVKVVILPNGSITAYVEEGTFDDGKKALQKVLAGLAGDGIDFADIGAVEMHKHENVGVENHVHNS